MFCGSQNDCKWFLNKHTFAGRGLVWRKNQDLSPSVIPTFCQTSSTIIQAWKIKNLQHWIFLDYTAESADFILFWMYAFKIFSFKISSVKFSRRNFLLLLSHKLVLPSEVGVWLWELLFTVGALLGEDRGRSLWWQCSSQIILKCSNNILLLVSDLSIVSTPKNVIFLKLMSCLWDTWSCRETGGWGS